MEDPVQALARVDAEGLFGGGGIAEVVCYGPWTLLAS